MSKGMTGREADPEVVYADIFHLPHHVSDQHPQMSLHDRATQFSPYAALVGYDDMVIEEARQVDNKIELGEEDIEELNRKLNRIGNAVTDEKKPVISVTYFIRDPFKPGGRYDTVTERIRKIDSVGRKIVLDRKITAGGAYMEISIADILDVHEEISDT